ncbi:MAG: hypothetical protein IJ896_03210 [Fibrobacter sp.]|nr:hypothetical protein [Fibrobacter sp.]
MMKECKDVITVFNARMDAEGGYDVYYPTTIRNVSVFLQVASEVTLSGLNAANKVTIRIPIDADFSGKEYVEPVHFAAADPATAFTLKQGDVIVEAEETEQLNPVELKAKYGSVITILGVTDNRKRPRAKHWKVVGT